ncbi:hypothetical protein CLV51_106136 [Chitinophaga niastensis]|uniref:Uncharacterized protein n=1 Tax=Chitinophaga niastensis TaxID=536980 RepID=A0A2P8HDG6_CHINA|nr:hypothetical protein CLV51_106136 [Chitinophaga niastensis]
MLSNLLNYNELGYSILQTNICQRDAKVEPAYNRSKSVISRIHHLNQMCSCCDQQQKLLREQ